MKKLFIINILIFIGFAAQPAYAASTPTPAPTKVDSAVQEKLDAQINQLKEKIASRVSELNLVEKRGVVGTVTEIKGNQITMTDLQGNTRFIDVDEITKFASPTQKTFGLSDITKGTKVSALGIYNKQSKRLLARFIDAYSEPLRESGAIVSIDAKNFQITIQTADQKTRKVDVDTTTKVSSYTVEEGLSKYGFSKLAAGDRVSITGSPGKSDPTIIAATRVVDFIGIPKDPRINVQAAATTAPTAAAAATTTTVAPITPTTATKRTLSPIR